MVIPIPARTGVARVPCALGKKYSCAPWQQNKVLDAKVRKNQNRTFIVVILKLKM